MLFYKNDNIINGCGGGLNSKIQLTTNFDLELGILYDAKH